MNALINDKLSYIICSATFDDTAGAILLNQTILPSVIVPVSFGRPFPVDTIPEGSDVYIVDVNYQVTELLAISKRYNLYWFTHDAKSINDDILSGLATKGVKDVNLCGCELVWKFLNGDKPMSDSLKLIADYDKWQFKDPRTKAFFYGLGTMKLYPGPQTFGTWVDILSCKPEVMELALSRGKQIEEYTTTHDKEFCEDLTFQVVIHGKSFLVANIRGCNSTFFSYHPNYSEVDGYITYGWLAADNKLRFSVYANGDKLNVAEFTAKFDGYGRAGVGGWVSDQLPWVNPTGSIAAIAMQFSSDELDRFSKTFTSRNRSNVVRSYSSHHTKTGLKSQMVSGTLFGKSALFSNIPYTWPDVWFDLNPVVDFGVTYCRTKGGRVRVVVSSFNCADMNALKTKVNGELNSFGNLVFYVDDIRRIPSLTEKIRNGL